MSWLKTTSLVMLIMLLSVNAIFDFVIVNAEYGQYVLIDPSDDFSTNTISSALQSIEYSLGDIVSSAEINNFFGFGTAALSLAGIFLFKLLPAMALGWMSIIDSITIPLGLGGIGLGFKAVLLGLEAIGIFYIILDIKLALRL